MTWLIRLCADVLDTFDTGEADSRANSTAPAAIVHAGATYSLGDLLTPGQPPLSAEGEHCTAPLCHSRVEVPVMTYWQC